MVSPTQLCRKYHSLPLSQRCYTLMLSIILTTHTQLVWPLMQTMGCLLWFQSVICSIFAIDLIHKSQNAPVPYPSVHHSEQKCTYFCSEWSIVGHGSGAFWYLWNWSIDLLYVIECNNWTCLTAYWDAILPASASADRILTHWGQLMQICIDELWQHWFR